MTHFRQSTRSQLPAYQYAYGNKTASGVCLQNVTDYSPFGVALDGRTIESDFYRRGFNGMEKDDEVKGEGNSYDFGARMYDARIGRWLSRDPREKDYVPFSPYIIALNSTLLLRDADGKVVVDGNGKPVTVSVTKAKNGTATATYEFAEGTSDEVKAQFMANAGAIFTAMLKTETGANLIQKANDVEHKVHYTLVKEEKVYDDGEGGSLGPLGATFSPVSEQGAQNPLEGNENMKDVYAIEVLEGNFEATQKQVNAGSKAGEDIIIDSKKVPLSEKRAGLATTIESVNEFRAVSGSHETKHFLEKNKSTEKGADKTHIKVQKEFKKSKVQK